MSHPPTQRCAGLLDNSRFYILCCSILGSLAVLAVTRMYVASDQLFSIRAEQLFGGLSVAYWYGALLISPLAAMLGKERMRHSLFARRAIGVSAAYFALLHGGIALWGQLGGVDELDKLPDLFRWSLLAGAAGTMMLLVMAATSFDAVIAFMTYRKWKWLHRLGYGAFILVTLHIWTIGTHISYSEVQWVAFGMLALLSGLESWRLVAAVQKKWHALTRAQAITVIVMFWTLWLVAIAGTPLAVGNYHAQHHSESGTHRHE